jgi:23S rRNA pseudouridine2605 synthase
MNKDLNKDDLKPIRINKYISNAGVCSRRAAEQLVKEGKVKVNGKIIKELGTKVERGDKVEVNGKLLDLEEKIYLLLNKPRNIITTRKDEKGRKTVMDLIPDKFKHLYPVGRLDRNTTGVLLLTNNGELANKLLHPSSKIKKVYKVKASRRLTQEELDLLVSGIELDDGVSKFDKIVELADDTGIRYGVEIHSGKNRIVRRMFQSIGSEVVKLDRVLFHTFEKRGIPKGKFRELKPREVRNLLNQLKLNSN